MPDSGKLNVLVICDKSFFKNELEEIVKGSHLNLLFEETIETARGKTVGSDVRVVLLPMSLNGRETQWFARELKRNLVKRPVVALYPDVAFKDQFAGNVLAAWPQDPLRVYEELRKLCGLY